MKPDLKTVFEKNREAFLDMELRGNSLLNLSNSMHLLDIIDRDTPSVFTYLTEQHKSMTFLPVVNAKDDDSKTTISLQNINKTHYDAITTNVYLPTGLTQKELDACLLRINADANTYLQEKGGNFLYLATGCLTWFEDINSFKPRHAPLILIPVELFRSDADAQYQIRYTGADLLPNLTLITKMKTDFGLVLPVFKNAADDYTLEEYFAEINQVVFKKARWAVEPNKITLGFFPVSDFVMYQDLSDDAWPEGKKPSENAILKKLNGEGFTSDYALINDQHFDLNKSEEHQMICCADSSQTRAILNVKTGANLVINGAPGSGKSQTITNLIAQALHQNKSVLFVAEKMAALDQVMRQLTACQLGDAVLELHPPKANLKSILSSLENSLLIEKENYAENEEDIPRLIYLREKLEAHCEATKSAIAKTPFNYQQALGHLSKYENILLAHKITPHAFTDSTKEVISWTAAHYESASETLYALIDYLNQDGSASANIYASTQKESFSGEEETALHLRVSDLIVHYKAQRDNVTNVAEQMGLTGNFHTVEDVQKVTASLLFLENKPELVGIKTDTNTWLNQGEQLIALAEEAMAIHQEINQLKNLFKQDAFTFDWTSISQTLHEKGRSFTRFLSGDFRKAKKTLSDLSAIKLKGGVDQWLQNINQLVEVRNKLLHFDVKANVLKDMMGIHYQNASTQWETLLPTLHWIHKVRKGLAEGQLDQGLEFYLIAQNKPNIDKNALATINAHCYEFDRQVKELCDSLLLDVNDFSQRFASLSFEQLDQLISDISLIYSLTKFTHLRNKLTELGCEQWGRMALQWDKEPALLAIAFQYSFFHSLVTTHYQQTAEIRQFDRNEHEQIITQFIEADEKILHLTQVRLAHQIQERIACSVNDEDIEIFRRKCIKKGQDISIRELMTKAGRTIQSIKPVFMMSPISIATYLSPGELEFDLVIFDEASQILVTDAFGALLRGKQIVVVGDTRQMPPLPLHYDQLNQDDDHIDPLNGQESESILGLFIASGAPQCELSWHYRSLHPSLFSVSNHYLYENQLASFPASGVSTSTQGAIHYYLAAAFYEGPAAKRNIDEAIVIASSVIKHIQTYPEFSLGVIALTVFQRDAILTELEKLRKAHPELEHYFSEQNDGNDFFVKSIEHCQGDERDFIFVSMTYGRMRDGQITQHFGVLSQEGGDKRLNVLMTRAKKTMRVFSNFSASDLQISDASSKGDILLKQWFEDLEYHQCMSTSITPSPFEHAVMTAINQLGFEIALYPTYDNSGIDIAVKDPDNNIGRNILLISCDGVTYSTTRDREHIRQHQLKKRDWLYYTIWSTDWFRDKQGEIERLSLAIESAKSFYQERDSLEITQEPIHHDLDKDIHQDIDSVIDYKICPLKELSLKHGDNLAAISTPTLSNEIGKIIEIENPIHIKQLTLRLLNSVDENKSGNRENAAILDAVVQLIRKGKIETDGEFLLLIGKEIYIRNRRRLPALEKKFDYVYDQEVSKAIIELVRDAGSIRRDMLVKKTASVLGFNTCSKATTLRIHDILQGLEDTETIKVQGDVFSF